MDIESMEGMDKDNTRIQLPDHCKQLLVDLVVDSQDILVYCEGGIVQSCRLVLACLSPLLRSILLQAEEPSIILPGVQATELQYFLQCLASTGNIEDHENIMNLLGVSLEGWVPTPLKVQDEEDSELLRTAQNLSLLSPLTWRRTTLELAGQSKDMKKIVRPVSLAKFSTVLDTDTDGFNQCFESDPLLRQKCDMYIGQTEAGFVCKLVHCTFMHQKKTVLKYHVLSHLNINPFNKVEKEEKGYVEFITNRFKKKTEEKILEKSEIQKDEFAIAVNELISDCPQPEPELSPSVLAPSKPKPDPEIPEILDSLIPDTDFLLPEPIEENQQAEIKPETNKKKRLKKKLSNKKIMIQSPSSSKKNIVEEMSDETRKRCDEFIVFVQTTREYKCVYTDCSYAHRSKTWLKYHVMKHLDISEYLCEECGEPFPMQKLLKKHVMTVHGSDELRSAIELWIAEDASNPSWYRCTFLQCGFAAATKKGAGLHALNEHMEKSYICDLCGEGFVTERSLQNHSNYHHNKSRNFDKLYPCAYCTKSFRTASYLEAHENEHKGVRPYQCDACGKSFASNGMLRSHKFAHAPKIFKCDCCDQAFPRKNTLMVHLRAVHMHEKPYECDICGQKFPRSSSMTRHRRIHTGLPRYQCHYCDKTTTQRGDLNRHMAKAHGWPTRDYRLQEIVHVQV